MKLKKLKGQMVLAQVGTNTDSHIILTVELFTNDVHKIDLNALLNLDKV